MPDASSRPSFPLREVAEMLLERHGTAQGARTARNIARALTLSGDAEGSRAWRAIAEEVERLAGT